jgi:integrase
MLGEVERDRWLTRDDADHLVDSCPPHLAVLAKFVLATEWERVDLVRHTAWLNQTKNDTPRGVPLNSDAIEVLEQEIGKHPCYCFTFRGNLIAWQISNTA